MSTPQSQIPRFDDFVTAQTEAEVAAAKSRMDQVGQKLQKMRQAAAPPRFDDFIKQQQPAPTRPAKVPRFDEFINQQSPVETAPVPPEHQPPVAQPATVPASRPTRRPTLGDPGPQPGGSPWQHGGTGGLTPQPWQQSGSQSGGLSDAAVANAQLEQQKRVAAIQASLATNGREPMPEGVTPEEIARVHQIAQAHDATVHLDPAAGPTKDSNVLLDLVDKIGAGGPPGLESLTSRVARPVVSALAQGGAGVLNAGQGALDLLKQSGNRGGPQTPALGNSLGEQAQQTSALIQGAERQRPQGIVARTAQDIGAGLVEFAPLMAAPEVEAESIFARIAASAVKGGAYTGLQAVGQGKTPGEVAQAAGSGAATFGVMGVPLPGKNVLTRAVSNLLITGGGATIVGLATGQPLSDAAKQGVILALMRSPDLIHGMKVQGPDGKTRDATPDDLAGLRQAVPEETQARLRQSEQLQPAAGTAPALTPQEGALPSVPPAEPVHHSELQPRNDAGQFDGPPIERRGAGRTPETDLQYARSTAQAYGGDVTPDGNGYAISIGGQTARADSIPDAVARVREAANVLDMQGVQRRPVEPDSQVGEAGQVNAAQTQELNGNATSEQARQLVNTLKWNMARAKELSAADAQTVLDHKIDFNAWASAKSEARRQGYPVEQTSRIAIDLLSGKLRSIPFAGSSNDPYQSTLPAQADIQLPVQDSALASTPSQTNSVNASQEQSLPQSQTQPTPAVREPWQMSETEWDKHLEQYDKNRKAETLKARQINLKQFDDVLAKARETPQGRDTIYKITGSEQWFSIDETGKRVKKWMITDQTPNRSGFYSPQKSIVAKTRAEALAWMNERIAAYNERGEYYPPEYDPEDSHEVLVEQALRDGKPVPAKVLADYPDLAARYRSADAQGSGIESSAGSAPSPLEPIASTPSEPEYPNVPEGPETIQSQLDARGYALIPENTTFPRPEGYSEKLTSGGVVYYDPKRISAETIRNTPTNELLGHVEPKGPDTTRAVVARDEADNEVHASAVSPGNEAAQVAETQRNFPGANVESGGPELAQRVLEDRIAANYREQHGSEEPLDRLLRHPRAADLFDRLGEANESEKNEFRRLARSQGVPDEAVENIITQSASSTPVPGDATSDQAGSTAILEQGTGAGDQSTGDNQGEWRDVTSIKNAAVESAREAMDLPELTPSDHQSWAEAGERAREQGLDTPDKADAIAEQVLSGKKPVLSAEEEAGLRDRIRGIENDYERLARETDAATDPADLAKLRVEGDMLRAKFQRLTDATKMAGKGIGRALAIRRSAVDKDMLLTQLGAERAYKLATGKEPSPEVIAEIKDLRARNADLQEKLTAHEERIKSDQVSQSVEKIRRDVVRETRGQKRKTQKKTLDDEAVDLKKQFAQVWKKITNQQSVQPSIFSRLDPEGELMKIVAKLVRNRVEANLKIPASELVDQVHGFLQDIGDLSRRDIREMISGFGRTPKPQSELQRHLNSLKAELRKGLKGEDIASGERTERKQGPPNMPRVNAQRNARLEKQITEVQRKIDEQDFSTKKREPPVYDAQGNRLRAQLEQVQRDFSRLKDKNRQTTVMDALARWKRFAVLTYGTTLGKLGGAATGRMAATPLYESLGQVGRKVMPKTFAEEPTPRGFLKGEVAAVKQLWQGDSFRDALSHLKGGEDLITLLYGEPGGDEFTRSSSGKTLIPRSVGEVMDRPGHIHAAIKTLPKRAAFFRYFERALDAEGNKANSRDISDPLVQLEIAGEAKAYQESQRAILQQGNPLTQIFNNVVSGSERSKFALARAVGKMLRFEFPITKVPVNFAGEVATHIGGLPAGLGEVAGRTIANRVVRPLLRTEAQGRLGDIRRNLEQRLPTAIDELEPEQRKRIARAIKVGGVGLGFVVWGAMRPDQFGGYYQPGKRDPNDVRFGGMRFMGINIPRWLGHIPPLEAAQFGATLRRVANSMMTKGQSKTEAMKEGGVAAIKGMAEEIPFIDPLINSAHGPGALVGKHGERQKYVGGELRSMIPGAIQQVAKASDYPAGTTLGQRLNPFSGAEPIARKPATVGDEVRMGIPGLRQHVPLNDAANARSQHDADLTTLRTKGNESLGDDELASRGYSKAQITSMRKDARMSQFQVDFANTHSDANSPTKALDRYERMDERQRYQVKNLMAQKAQALLDRADYLLNNAKAEDKSKRQEERDKLQQRLDALGIQPEARPTNKKSTAFPAFKPPRMPGIPAMR